MRAGGKHPLRLKRKKSKFGGLASFQRPRKGRVKVVRSVLKFSNQIVSFFKIIMSRLDFD